MGGLFLKLPWAEHIYFPHSFPDGEEVLIWLQTKDTWELGELEYKLAFE